ncbi:MAG: glycosyltransferase 87 family protein [Patiriisocius sp.]|uniref:glycosyltransferase 87 family protein n=1 Tax=Patiriisocius sp. TaxID=2822396 RepID=UPI003EF5474C
MNASIKENYSSLLLILLSVAGYFYFGHSLERTEFLKLLFLYSGLFFCAWRLIKQSKFNFWVLAGIGVFFRLLFLPAIPNLSQDFYRFIWDGRILLEGFNPYLFTPDVYFIDLSTALGETKPIIDQATQLRAGMGDLNASHYSNYPPVNQLLFTVAALFAGKSILSSAIVLRILIILADVGILYFGKKLLERLQLPVKNIFWYFLNPFIIIELTGNLHFEGVMLLFVVWSLYLLQKGKWFWAAVLLGISVSVKLLPLMFLPLFFKRFYKKEISTALNLTSSFKFYAIVIGTVLLTFAPFLSGAFISNFAATIGLWFGNFEFNASVYYIIRWIGFETVGWNIIGVVGKILPLITITVILFLSLFRRNNTMQQLITGIVLAVSFYFLLSTTVHPWYIATPLLLSVFTRYKFPIIWSFVVMVSYSAYGADGFSENLWLVALEYFVVIGFAIWEFKKPSSQTCQLPQSQ